MLEDVKIERLDIEESVTPSDRAMMDDLCRPGGDANLFYV